MIAAKKLSPVTCGDAPGLFDAVRRLIGSDLARVTGAVGKWHGLADRAESYAWPRESATPMGQPHSSTMA